MACYLKSIDGYHLLEVGLEGFYGASSSQKNPNNALYGTDFIANHQIPEVDFGTVHSYPDNWYKILKPHSNILTILIDIVLITSFDLKVI